VPYDRRVPCGVGAAAALVLVCLPSTLRLSAQSQAIALRYSAGQLNCARFYEAGESNIQTQSGRQIRQQTSGRRGVWQFRAASSDDDIALEGWLDSLVLWRRSAETTIRPDTDGLVGGRYRGTLTGAGWYVSRARPFVPDEVAEVAGMGTALDDFFPPLPPRPLRPGQSWNDSLGLTIRRMPDSAWSGVVLYRFELEDRREARSAELQGDTLALELRQVTRERGSFVWHSLLGLVGRERRIVVETAVPAKRPVRQAVRSKIEQRISLRRDLTTLPDSGRGCEASSS
jgi:hypothetical protein